MNLHQIPWIKLLLVALVGAAIWWFYATKMEWYESTETKGYSKTARENHLLASTRLIEAFGYRTKRLNSIETIRRKSLPTDEILWVLYADALTYRETQVALVDWINSGGHLILGIDETIGEGVETFIHSLGLEFAAVTKDEDLSASVITLKPKKAIDSITVQINSRADLYPSTPLIQGIKRSGTDQNGDRPYAIAQIENGKGVVTALGDARIFTNQRLDDHDNASLLLTLLWSHPGKTVHYFTGVQETPGLMRILWEKFPVTIIALCVALAAWVFYAASRLGPIRHEVEPGRTNLVSHLRARGHFWRRRKNFSSLSDPVKQAALREIRLNYRIPSANSDIPDHVFQDIAQSTGSSAGRVKRVLSDRTLSESELPNAAILLHKILSSTSTRSQHITRLNP